MLSCINKCFRSIFAFLRWILLCCEDCYKVLHFSDPGSPSHSLLSLPLKCQESIHMFSAMLSCLQMLNKGKQGAIHRG